jgi:3-isopropylmalate/(R)-2-methylmalate dehydratase large subunit
VVRKIEDGPDVFFIDRHFIHYQSCFLGLKKEVLFLERTFATADHNTPTINQHLPVEDPLSANQLSIRRKFQRIWDQPLGIRRQKNGIVHVVGPENGITLPGATIVCGDSIPTRCLWCHCFQVVLGGRNGPFCNVSCSQNPRCLFTSLVIFNWELHQRRCIIYHLKTIHFRRYWLFCGVRRKSFEDMTMEGRMTVCNLSRNRSWRNDCPDQTTFDYLEGRLYAPKALLGIQP